MYTTLLFVGHGPDAAATPPRTHPHTHTHTGMFLRSIFSCQEHILANLPITACGVCKACCGDPHSPRASLGEMTLHHLRCAAPSPVTAAAGRRRTHTHPPLVAHHRYKWLLWRYLRHRHISGRLARLARCKP